MNARSIILLCIALIVGTSLAVATKKILNAIPENQETAVSEIKMVPVMVAKQDIHFGDELTPQNIRLDRFPEDKVPAEAIKNFCDAKHRFVKKDLVKGDLISVYDLNDLKTDEPSRNTYDPVNNSYVSFVIDSVFRHGEAVRSEAYLNELRNVILPESDTADFVLTFEKKDAAGNQRTSTDEVIFAGAEVSSAKVRQEQIDAAGTIKCSLELSFFLEKDNVSKLEEARKRGKVTIILHSSQDRQDESGLNLNQAFFDTGSAEPEAEAFREKSDHSAETNLNLSTVFASLSSPMPEEETLLEETGDSIENGREQSSSDSSEDMSASEKAEETASADETPLGVSVPRSNGESSVTSSFRPRMSVPRPETTL